MRFISLSFAALAGCALYSSQSDDAPPSNTETHEFPNGPINRKLDLLFVVDDSGSMGEEQANLSAGLARFVNTLAAIEGGMPDLHAGVVSTDMGSGNVNIGGCTSASRPQGDGGILQINECGGLTERFLAIDTLPDGSRHQNFSGELAGTLSCLARLGTQGCGFEQPLEAMRTALLVGRNPGFRRDDARLAIVFVTDEDDCSALPGGALFGDPSADIDSELGPRTSFRCFEHGVVCGNDPNPRTPGTRSACRPRDDSPFMQRVSSYVEQVQGLAGGDVLVTAMLGPVDAAGTVTVGPDPDDGERPALQPSCSSSSGIAFPAVRLQAFVDAFAGSSTSSICASEQPDALFALAEQIRERLTVPCFDRAVVDHNVGAPGVQGVCSVTEFSQIGGFRIDPVDVPSCDVIQPGPCWRIVEDDLACPVSGMTLQIDRRSSEPAPAGRRIEATCGVVPA